MNGFLFCFLNIMHFAYETPIYRTAFQSTFLQLVLQYKQN